MQMLTDVYIECEECHGRRYSKEALEIYYKGKNIADVLDMTVETAHLFPRCAVILRTQHAVRRFGYHAWAKARPHSVVATH